MPDPTGTPNKRYFVNPPVEGPEGYPYFEVCDSQDKEMPNKPLVSLWKELPGTDARELAESLCQMFNDDRRTKILVRWADA